MRTPIHPGKILSDELKELDISARRLAEIIDVPPNRIYQIINGKRELTADTALRLARYFGTSDEFWLNLQKLYDLDLARRKIGSGLKSIPRRSSSQLTAS
ncbi:MAG: HigA family addiction module antitoxin [Nitrospira sp.]|nr:HigA family addiction module antitoxin [Nitrospira sp.]